MLSLFLIFLYLNLKAVLVNSLYFKIHPDAGLNIPLLLTKYGYPVEVHKVMTEDEYILTIFRIPHGKKTTKVYKYPIVLVPGTCGTAENFLATGPDNAIAYYFADRGFDVWLTNIRGNMHGREHKQLNADRDRSFWNFGWHEVGIYDTPALVDYILGVTNSSQVFYIGHSQGTTSFFTFAIERPEYNDKIKLSVHMAPSILFKESRSLSQVLGKHLRLLEGVFKILDVYVLFPKPINTFLNSLGQTLCAEMTILSDICYLVLYFFTYSRNNLIDPNHLQLIFQTSPGGCSTKELFHYFQITRSGKFRKYDYGIKENLKLYGTRSPPLYNLSQLTSPVSLFFTENDNLVPSKGVRQLATLLPNLDSIYSVPNEYFNHVDFIFSNVTKELVNDPIYDLFMKHINTDKL